MARIGLEIGGTVVRAYSRPRSGAARVIEVFVHGSDVEQAIATALSQVPRQRLSRPQVLAGVGPSACQYKRLVNVPRSRPDLAAAIVRENVGRFFLKNGKPLITAVERQADDAVFAAAYDEPVLKALAAACARERCRLIAAAPAMILLKDAVGGVPYSWQDGDVIADAVADSGHLRITRRRADDTAAQVPRELPSEIADCDPRFAVAFAAATCSVTGPLFHSVARRRAPVSPLRSALAVTAALCALLFAFLTPPLAFRLARARAAARLLAIEPAARQAARQSVELGRFTRALDDASTLAKDRSRVAAAFAELTARLPDSSAFTHLRIDSSSITATIVTRRASDVLHGFEQSRTMGAAEVLGPVVRTPVSGRDMEQFSARLRFR